MIINYKNYFFVLIFFSSVLSAQTKNQDTVKNIHANISFERLFYQPNNLPGIDNSYLYLPYAQFNYDTSLVWIRTRMQLNSFNEQNNFDQLQLSILNPLQQNYDKLQTMKTVKAILGSIQAGAVGYLAYKHLKKYGFLKKR